MVIKTWIGIASLVCAGFPAPAQLSEFYPDVGDQMPAFTLHDVRFSDRKQLSSEQLKGRHVILDFFTVGCTACFESMPKLSHIQREKKDNLDIFMVGWDVYGLSSTFSKYREKLKLELRVSYDSMMFKQFSVTGVPYLIWIDDKGAIKAITTSGELTAENLSAFLANKPVATRNFNVKRGNAALQKQDTGYILRLAQYAEMKSISAGTFVPWNSTMPMSDGQEVFHYIGKNAYFQIMGLPLYQYINFAYTGQWLITPPDSPYGKIFTNAIYELDSAQIPVDDYDSNKSMYCYSMVTDNASATPERLAESLRGDLKGRLGFDITMETRMMPCWVVTARPGAGEKLKSKYDSVWVKGTNSHFFFAHHPASYLIDLLSGINQRSPPFIDETGLTGYIDLDLDALITDFEDVRKVLDKNGIVVTPSRRLMKVLVVRKQDKRS